MIGEVYNSIRRLYYSKTNSKQRIKYLRKLGVKIGKDCHVYSIDFSTEPYLISIGNHTNIGYDVSLITHDAAVRCFKPVISGGFFGKITIGDNVFVGNHSIILPNTVIGDNCIIGAGSVIRGKIPANSVVMGNPGKVISRVSVIQYFYQNSPGLLQTDDLKKREKDKLVKQVLCTGQ